MDEVSEQAIAEVCDFASLDPIEDRTLVISALKAKAGSVQAVVLAYYDDPAKFRQTYTWDETTFTGDRDGAKDETNLPTFNIQGPDEGVIHGVSPTDFNPVAPSRPPSRAQSPLSRVAEWAGHGVVGPASVTQEDQDLERALAESAAMSGIHTPQETGLTINEAAAELPFFGPANRDGYDPDQWAMVLAAPDVQDPPASGRKRAPGVPAFLRFRRNDNTDLIYLGAILTVLHAIPAARSALLSVGVPASTYGHNPEWWKGSSIKPVGTPGTDNAPESDDGDDVALMMPIPDHDRREFVEEIQRLMAFLDGTDRAYGTADSFVDFGLMKLFADRELDVDRCFFKALRHLALPDVLNTFFSEATMFRMSNLEEPSETDLYALLDMQASSKECPGGINNMYNGLDTVYWADLTRYPEGGGFTLQDETRMAVISHLSPVTIIRASFDNLYQPIDVPELLHVDRYMVENREVARQTQMRLLEIYQLIDESEKARRKILWYEDISDRISIRRDKSTLSEQALSFDTQKMWQFKSHLFWKRLEESRGSEHEFDFSIAGIDRIQPEKEQEWTVFRSIQAEMAVHRAKLIEVRKKLAKLNAERAALEKLADATRQKRTAPSVSDGWSPKYTMRLRGVITSPNRFYFCRHDELMAGDEAMTTAASSNTIVDQWWMVSYNAQDAEPASVLKTTVEVARYAAFRETQSPTLIYCLDSALEGAEELLPDALRTFIRFDNRYFKQELAEESPREKKRQPADDASQSSPLKRQQRSNSIDSMASNMASFGEVSDRDVDDVPLPDEHFAFDSSEGHGGVKLINSIGTGVEADSRIKPEKSTAASPLRGDPTTKRESRKDGSLGTEMVQLSISHTDIGADTIGGASDVYAFGTGEDLIADDAATMGDDSTEADANKFGSETKKTSGSSKSSTADGCARMQLIADWDNPEGRLVEKTRQAKEIP